MRQFICLLVLLSLTSCGYIDRAAAYIKGYNITCVSEVGVKYITFNTGTSILVDQSGKPVPCDK